MEYFKGSQLSFEKIIEEKYQKSFKSYSRNQVFKMNNYLYNSQNKPYVYLVCYYLDKNYTEKIAEWKYDGKIGTLI